MFLASAFRLASAFLSLSGLFSASCSSDIPSPPSPAAYLLFICYDFRASYSRGLNRILTFDIAWSSIDTFKIIHFSPFRLSLISSLSFSYLRSSFLPQSCPSFPLPIMFQASSQIHDPNLVSIPFAKFSHNTSPYGTRNFIWNHVGQRDDLDLIIRNNRVVDEHGNITTQVTMKITAGADTLVCNYRFANTSDTGSDVALGVS